MFFLITALLASGAAASCNADNCLRALKATARLSEAQQFCATFTQGGFPATAIPTFAAQACVKNQNAPLEERISSACDCIAPFSIETSMPVMTMPLTSLVPVMSSVPTTLASSVSSGSSVELSSLLPTTLIPTQSPLSTFSSVKTSTPVSSTSSPPSSSVPTTSSLPKSSSVPVTSSSSTSSSFGSTTTSATSKVAACAIVSSSSSAQRSRSPNATPTVSAQLAHDCLNSVPLNKGAAIELVDSMEPYLEWQSDSAFKKNPPANYFYPPHDIFGYLASVKTNLQNDKYANEYEFQEDLYQIFARAHDGHFIFYPDALTGAFQFTRKRSLVSISEDGASLPQIKVFEDVINSPTKASVVKLINGIDAATYVADFAYTATFNQDPDAAYNSMFYEKAYVAGGVSKGYFSGGGRMRYIYPGANTTFTFANGTSLVLDNIAQVKGSFSGVTDGESFYERFCVAPSDSASSIAAIAAVDASDALISAPGYPAPVIITNDTIVSGYYLNDSGYEDVAVISLLAFENESPIEFQQVAQQFFAEAKQAGKTKLVIDLSANGGGYILQGYDLFRQLFPDIVQDGFSRFRENDMLLAIAQIASAESADFNPSTSTSDEINEYENFYNYRYDLNLTNDPFTIFGSKFDPQVYLGDSFTSILRWNLNDPLTTSNETYGLGTDITGYRSRTNFTQPFAAEDIIMLYDGFCASTCTLFSEFMRIQAGVKSIAMGGRPKVGPIQGVGGIKGAEILGWNSIYSNAQSALENATISQAAILNRLTDLPIQRSTATGSNVRDQILRDNLDDGLPAQFVVEEADCRLYWTLPMVTDVTAVWKAAADSAFNGKPCVAGGFAARKRDVQSEEEEKKRREVNAKKMRKVVNGASKRVHFEKRELSAEWTARHVVKAIP